MRRQIKYHISIGELYCLDALALAMESHSRINMVMLGALVRASGLSRRKLPKRSATIRSGKNIPHSSKPISRVCAWDMKMSKWRRGDRNLAPLPDAPADRYAWGYANAPAGGVNPRIGSTVSNDLTASREGYIPLFIQEKCINCGLCDTACPDMVFQFAPGTYRGKNCMVNRGLDYYHCKGCLRCVEVCPHQRTRAGTRKKITRKNRIFFRISICCPTPSAIRPSVRIPGSQAILFTDEKRVDGGVV